MLTPEQLELRKTGIGASEIASVCGLNPNSSALDVWMVKTGRKEPDDLSKNPFVEWGNRLEAVVAKKYADAHGVEITRNNVTHRHKIHKFMLATPDGEVWSSEDGAVFHGLEVKTAGIRSAWRWGDEGDDIPQEYLLQVAWSCAVLDYDRWDLAVLIAGNDYREYTYHRDAALELRLIEIATEFWECVEKDVPPEPDASEATKAALVRLYPKNLLEIVASTGEVDEWIEKLRVRKSEFKSAETAVWEMENKLKAFIGAADGVEGPLGKILWKANKPGTKTAWHEIANELGASEELVAKWTTEKPGARVFNPKFKD